MFAPDKGAVFLARALASEGRHVTKASTDSLEDVADVGLGLSICRSIIEAHGGKLWALPRSPFGTTFYLTLPSAEAADRTDLDTNDSC